MITNKHLFIIPISTLSRKGITELLFCGHDFISEEFVLQNAVQIWIDYQQDPSGGWHTNVEDEIHREYGKYLSDLAGKAVFREGRGVNIKDQIAHKNNLIDSLASEIAKEISEVSNYLMSITGEDEMLDLVLDSEHDLFVTEAWIVNKTVKFVIEEL